MKLVLYILVVVNTHNIVVTLLLEDILVGPHGTHDAEDMLALHIPQRFHTGHRHLWISQDTSGHPSTTLGHKDSYSHS